MKKHKIPDLVETIAVVLVCGACIGAVTTWGWFDKPERVETPEPAALPIIEPIVELTPEPVEEAEPVEQPVVQAPAPVEIVALAVQVVEPVPEVIVEELVVEEAPTYTEMELETLALIIYQEAGADACSDETRQMVGEVVLNRVESPHFPDTIEEVALQQAQYGRLHWTGLVWPERAASSVEAHAVERAYNMARDLLDGSVERLLPTDTIFQAEFTQGVEVVAQTDGFYFCR